MSPILFLDVDGVLNGHAQPGMDGGIDPNCARLLAEVVKKTRCEIVVSSAWRYMGIGRNSVLIQCLYGSLFSCLGAHEAGRVFVAIEQAIVGALPLENPNEPPVPRDVLIESWLRKNKKVRCWVAVDDLPCIARFGTRAVVCDSATGMTKADAEKVIKSFETQA